MEDFVFPNEVEESRAMNGKVLGPGILKGGLTKREYFAAMAMLGHFIINQREPEYMDPEKCAQGSLAMADALIKALT